MQVEHAARDLGVQLRRGGASAPPTDRHAILTHFKTTGAVLLRGLDLDLDGFRTLTEDLFADFGSYAGGGTARPTVGGDETLTGVAEPGHDYPIPLHSEMSYVRDRPLALAFFCVRPAAECGETTVGDGVQFARELSAATRELFDTRGVRYTLRHPAGRWQKIFLTDDLEEVRRKCAFDDQRVRIDEDGTVIQECVRPAFIPSRFGGEPAFANGVLTQARWEADGGNTRLVRLGDGTPIPTPVLEELGRIESALTRDVAWHPGDVLLVDNTRILHGRRGHSDPQREIYLRMAHSLAS